MTVLEVLAILEAAVLGINTPEITHRFEFNYEDTRWMQILTTECGFFSAEHLRRLLRRR